MANNMQIRMLLALTLAAVMLSGGAAAQYWYDYQDDYGYDRYGYDGYAPTAYRYSSGHYGADGCWNCFDHYNMYGAYREPFIVANGAYYPYTGQDPYVYHTWRRPTGRYYDGYRALDRQGVLFPDGRDYFTGWNRFY